MQHPQQKQLALGAAVAREAAPPARRRSGSVMGVQRGPYRCKGCGHNKRGHICPFPRPAKRVPYKTKALLDARRAMRAAAACLVMCVALAVWEVAKWW